MTFDQHESVAVAIVRADDGVAIMQFVARAWSSKAPDREAFERAPTAEAIAAEVAKATAAWPAEWLPAKGWRVVAAGALPADRRYRDAWRDDGAKVGIDVHRARALRLGIIRAERNARLDDLDRLWNRATGWKNQAEADAIETERQALRDLPAKLAGALAEASSADALDAIGLSQGKGA